MDEAAKNLLSDISAKLDVLIALEMKKLPDGALDPANKRKQGVGDAARFLSGLGLPAVTIAKVIGAPIGSIRTLLTPSRIK